MLRSRLGLVMPTLLALVATLAAVPATPATASMPYADRRTGSPASPPAGSMADRIRALPHVVSVSTGTAEGGYQAYTVGIRQPVDHARPRGASFVQRLVLLDRGTDRPTVLVTNGYTLSSYLSEPAQLLDANQIAVEHRFFGRSRPDGATRAVWARALTIRQAAADHHRVVTVFKRLYPKRWVSTGVSKSGMTATYFRRFYPDDVAATVAYVAPDDVVDADDSYNAFLARVGTAECRDAVVAVQRRALGVDRDWFLERTRQEARDLGWTWKIVGDSEKAFEAGVTDVAFAFWQYQQADYACAEVPSETASRPQVWRWFEEVSPLTLYADQALRRYVPYYYQAVAQLGAPEPDETRIGDLLTFPGADVAATFVPAWLRPVEHDTAAMPDVDRWVRTRSTRMIFVYGGNDPWSAEPFSCGPGGGRRGCHRYVVDGGTHGSQLFDLPRSQRHRATALLRRWAGLSGPSRRTSVPPTVTTRSVGARPS